MEKRLYRVSVYCTPDEADIITKRALDEYVSDNRMYTITACVTQRQDEYLTRESIRLGVNRVSLIRKIIEESMNNAMCVRRPVK